MHRLVFTVLGCGTAAGVPAVGVRRWGSCDPRNRKNRRKRCSLLVQWREGGRRRSLLVDSSPDCREQLLRARVRDLDAVLYTHDHADHCHGIDDLKWIRIAREAAIPAYGSAETMAALRTRFSYIFPSSSSRLPFYRVILEPRVFASMERLSFGDLEVLALPLDHGFGKEVFGFRFGRDFAYTTDCVSIPATSFEALRGIKVWIVGCLRREAHPTHAHVGRVLEWVEELRPERVYLTHMNFTMDYDSLCRELPSGVRPAHDFLRIEVGDLVEK